MDYLLQENGSYLLQETGDKIILQEGVSASLSPSATASFSQSLSPSLSSSLSPSSTSSASISLSPSLGYGNYTRGDETYLPDDDDDLETFYTDEEETYISTRNGVMVGQTGILQYMIHQFKQFVGDNTFIQVEVEAQSTLSPSLSTVYLQIFNYETSRWETINTNTGYYVDTNFELSAKIANLTAYKNNQIITCRVYQEALE